MYFFRSSFGVFLRLLLKVLCCIVLVQRFIPREKKILRDDRFFSTTVLFSFCSVSGRLRWIFGGLQLRERRGGNKFLKRKEGKDFCFSDKGGCFVSVFCILKIYRAKDF